MGEGKLRIAISGAKHGRWHAREIRRLERDLGLCELVAVCRATNGAQGDFYEPMQSEGLPSTPVPHFTQYGEMLDQVTPDAVIIASPGQFHYDQTMRALEARCAVYLEKPSVWNPEETVAQNREDGAQLFSYAEAEGVLLCGGTQLTTWFEWPGSGFYAIAPKLETEAIHSFGLRVGTGTGKPIEELLADMLPHPYGVLRAIAGEGSLAFDVPRQGRSPSFVQEGQHGISVQTTYQRTEHQPVAVHILLDAEPGKRYLDFSVNGVTARREIVAQPYAVRLVHEIMEQEVPDPLRLALFGFVAELVLPDTRRRLEERNALRDVHTMLCDTLDAYRGRSLLDLTPSHSLSAAGQQSS